MGMNTFSQYRNFAACVYSGVCFSESVTESILFVGVLSGILRDLNIIVLN